VWGMAGTQVKKFVFCSPQRLGMYGHEQARLKKRGSRTYMAECQMSLKKSHERGQEEGGGAGGHK